MMRLGKQMEGGETLRQGSSKKYSLTPALVLPLPVLSLVVSQAKPNSELGPKKSEREPTDFERVCVCMHRLMRIN